MDSEYVVAEDEVRESDGNFVHLNDLSQEENTSRNDVNRNYASEGIAKKGRFTSEARNLFSHSRARNNIFSKTVKYNNQ